MLVESACKPTLTLMDDEKIIEKFILTIGNVGFPSTLYTYELCARYTLLITLLSGDGTEPEEWWECAMALQNCGIQTPVGTAYD